MFPVHTVRAQPLRMREGGAAVPRGCREQRGGPAAGQVHGEGRGYAQLGAVSPRPRTRGAGVPVWQVRCDTSRYITILHDTI